MNPLKKVKVLFARMVVRRHIEEAEILRVIFGAGGTSYSGWISTDYPVLDVTDQTSWARLFKIGTIDALLSEHVLEHLTDYQVALAISHSYKYLRGGGYIRIAVPDGYHPRQEYIDMIKPGGSGMGADDHKQLFNYKSLSICLEKAGFKVRLLEWFNEDGEFNHREWLAQDGLITRSSRHDDRNVEVPLSYTSLILDAVKA